MPQKLRVCIVKVFIAFFVLPAEEVIARSCGEGKGKQGIVSARFRRVRRYRAAESIVRYCIRIRFETRFENGVYVQTVRECLFEIRGFGALFHRFPATERVAEFAGRACGRGDHRLFFYGAFRLIRFAVYEELISAHTQTVNIEVVHGVEIFRFVVPHCDIRDIVPLRQRHIFGFDRFKPLDVFGKRPAATVADDDGGRKRDGRALVRYRLRERGIIVIFIVEREAVRRLYAVFQEFRVYGDIARGARGNRRNALGGIVFVGFVPALKGEAACVLGRV